MNRRAIVWFRNDLRLHDNEALLDALKSSDETIFAYIFDERTFLGETSYGFRKTEWHRAQFLIQSVIDLKKSLQKHGSDLYVRVGIPEDEIYQLAQTAKTSWVYCNRERTDEEVKVQNRLEKKLWTIGQELRFYRGKMLLYTADLPFPVTQTPDVFSQFRKEVENFVKVRAPFESPREPLNSPTIKLDYGFVPTLQVLGYHPSDEELEEKQKHFVFFGGETAALERMDEYFWSGQFLSEYKETRNGLIGRNFSSKFSPWLANGCLSPKYVYEKVKEYESKYGANDSTYWLIFELLWRDFFRFMGKKHGNKIFQFSGTREKPISEKSEDQNSIKAWIKGNTGVPFIDANMRELNTTGFMSNRGRQNVASYLVKDLKLNWLIGAEYFESLLIDYDPCSNYGNWNYIAGVGSDPRQDRYFNVVGQGKRYDPETEFIKYWIPELALLSPAEIHDLGEIQVKNCFKNQVINFYSRYTQTEKNVL